MSEEYPRFQDRIAINPAILAGKPVVRGTRVPVALVLKRLAQNLNLAPLFEAYPRLTPEDVQACLEYAHALVDNETLFPSTAVLSEEAIQPPLR